MRLRWALASRRCSGLMSDLARLRGGSMTVDSSRVDEGRTVADEDDSEGEGEGEE